MNVFADCPLKGAELPIQSGHMKGEIFIVEGWARDIMGKRLDWPSDMGNPAVLNFWIQRQDILTLARENSVECARVALTGLYGHVGWAGYLMLPEELGVDAVQGPGTLSASQVSNAVYAHSIHADCADADWQAIADELNNTLGSSNCTNSKRTGDERGMCHLERASWDDGTCTWGCICSACDAHLEHETGIGYNYCPICGAKVVDA